MARDWQWSDGSEDHDDLVDHRRGGKVSHNWQVHVLHSRRKRFDEERLGAWVKSGRLDKELKK